MLVTSLSIALTPLGAATFAALLRESAQGKQ
jgi:hypothetical protein